MRFSILLLMSATLLIALSIGIAKNWKVAAKNEVEIVATQSMIDAGELKLGLGQVEIDREFARLPKLVEALKSDAERSVAIFQEIREKYSEVKPAGRNVVSFRALNSNDLNDWHAWRAIKVWVPEDRPVWLKFGIHSPSRSEFAKAHLGELYEATSFSFTGPFECRLDPGDHLIESRVYGGTIDGSRLENQLTIEIQLDGQPLLSTTYQDWGASRTLGSAMGAWDQKDTPANKPLPWLYKMLFRVRKSDGQLVPTYGTSVWLGDQSSNAVGFPKQ